jgi:hypothetical protein
MLSKLESHGHDLSLGRDIIIILRYVCNIKLTSQTARSQLSVEFLQDTAIANMMVIERDTPNFPEHVCTPGGRCIAVYVKFMRIP